MLSVNQTRAYKPEEVGDLLGVSRSTVYRSIMAEGLLEQSRWAVPAGSPVSSSTATSPRGTAPGRHDP
jgi:predicted transcriptional regulator